MKKEFVSARSEMTPPEAGHPTRSLNNKIPLIIIGLLALLCLSTFIVIRVNAVNTAAKNELSGGLVLFFGSTCPHCVKVEQFLTDNKIEEKTAIDKKEVFENKDNAALLGATAKKCGLNAANVGVPFLWDGANQKCLIGDVDIINFFQQKINQ